MAGNQRDPKKESFWRHQIRGQARSGMTARAWCTDQGVNQATFHWWRRELARRDAEQNTPVRRGRPPARRTQRGTGTSTSQRRRTRRSTAPPAFIPVQVTSDDPQGNRGRIEIALADGRCVRVIGVVDRQSLVDVLAAMEHRPC